MRHGPLADTKVVDLTSFIAGPFACSLLGDLGAEVTKIEPPGGDAQRHYPSTLEGESRAFLGVNRGKKAIVINLKDEAGKAILLRLIRSADVLVENFRPSVPVRLGIDYEILKKHNPMLIYCAIRGYGDSGPLRDHPGYDQVVQTMSGIAAFQGASTRQGAEIVRGAFIDFYAASIAAMGIVAALYNRARTGEGEYVSTSLLAAALTMQAGRLVWAAREPREVDRELKPGLIAGIHPTKAGGLYISAHTERFWENLCKFLGLSDLAVDPRYNSSRKRSSHADELVPKIRAALQRRTAIEWAALMKGQVPCASVGVIEDMFDHPQVLAENLLARFEHSEIGGYRALSRPVRFGATPPPEPIAAPILGQHTDEILTAHGFSAAEIGSLRQRRVVS